MYAGDYAKQNLNEVTIAYIKDRILSGELKSGDKIVENDISEALEISRAPVREGLRELNTSGLLTYLPRRGSYVMEISQEELHEIFEIRTSLELQVLNILIRKQCLRDEDFVRLSAMTGKMASFEGKELDQREKLYNLNYLDISFHRYLWRASQSHKRYQLLDDLFFQLLISMNRDVVSLGSFSEKAKEHERITTALQERSPSDVFHAFSDHLKEYMTAIIPGAELLDLTPRTNLFVGVE